MAKRFLFTNDKVDALLAELKEEVKSKKRVYEPISLTIKPETVDKKALLIFSSKAYTKTRSLIDLFSTEIEWHGFVKRVNETTFFVEDIVVFPHEVTPVTVTSKQEEYDQFFESLTEEQQANFKFHGHSHVSMGTNPSSLDISKQKDVVNNLGIPRPGSQEDLFYVFFIGNKRNEATVRIYDVTNDVIFEKQDVTIDVQIEDGLSFIEFANNSRKLITETTLAIHNTAQQKCGFSATQSQGTKFNHSSPVKQSSLYEDDYYEDYYSRPYGYNNQGKIN